MGYKLIVSDMDETLLNDNREISENNLKMIKLAKEKYGIKFVPATGRGYASIQNELARLGLHDLPGEYVISYNGAIITENIGNTLLRSNGLDYNIMKEIFDFGLTKNVCQHVYTKDTVYVFNVNQYEKEEIDGYNGGRVYMEENSVDFLKNEKIYKILFQNPDVPYLMSLEKPMKNLTENCTVSYSSNRYMEFNSIGIDKGNGLRSLAEILGIDVKDTIAVGDNYNDISMLKTAGLSIAVSNAVDDAKKAAHYVTEADNNKGAVAELIEKFIINRIQLIIVKEQIPFHKGSVFLLQT